MKQILTLLVSILSITTFSQNWNEVIKAVASDRGADDWFGYSVSISGNKAIVGAYREDEDVSGGSFLDKSGSAYIFELNGGVWSQTAKLVASDRAGGDYFGYSVSISGDKAIVSAPWESQDASGGNYLNNTGSVYIYELSGGVWSQTVKLVASDRGAGDLFGRSICISGDKVIVGASLDDEDVSGGSFLDKSGSAYIFELSGGVWAQAAKLVASDRASSDIFGYSVSLSGDRAIVGAIYEDQDASGGNTLSNSGSAYVFELNGGVWNETAKLVSSDRGAGDEFAFSLGLSGDRVIIGAYKDDEDVSGGNTLNESGSAYIFEFIGGVWTQTAKLVALDRGLNDQFAQSVSISGNKAIVGAYREDEDVSGGNFLDKSGSAYVFEFNGGTWSQTSKLVASDRASNDIFGNSVSISGDKAIVGARWEDEDASGGAQLSGSGSAYFFEPSLVGVDDLGLIFNNLKLYPNPTTGNITIDLNELDNVNILIINSIGVEVFNTRNVTENKIDISLNEFSNGIYFIKVQSGNKFYTKKIIKQ